MRSMCFMSGRLRPQSLLHFFSVAIRLGKSLELSGPAQPGDGDANPDLTGVGEELIRSWIQTPNRVNDDFSGFSVMCPTVFRSPTRSLPLQKQGDTVHFSDAVCVCQNYLSARPGSFSPAYHTPEAISTAGLSSASPQPSSLSPGVQITGPQHTMHPQLQHHCRGMQGGEAGTQT